MPLYVCIDGGGTKTTAVVIEQSRGVRRVARGEAGPSNLSFGVEACVRATNQAVQTALAALNTSERPSHFVDAYRANQPLFARAWAGYAGCARPADFAKLEPALAPYFPRAHFRLSSDGALLTSPMTTLKCDLCVSLICGTGSLGILWRNTGSGVEQVARSGGWGSVLGDEGSGWSLGRAGIKQVLERGVNGQELRPWHRQILAQWSVELPDDLLLPVIQLRTDMDAGLAEAERKTKIAACSRIVVDAAVCENDSDAQALIERVAAEVVDTLRPLVSRLDSTLPQTLLSVTGGLSRALVFWQAVERQMGAARWNWLQVVHVDDPGLQGARALLVADQ